MYQYIIDIFNSGETFLSILLLTLSVSCLRRTLKMKHYYRKKFTSILTLSIFTSSLLIIGSIRWVQGYEDDILWLMIEYGYIITSIMGILLINKSLIKNGK